MTIHGRTVVGLLLASAVVFSLARTAAAQPTQSLGEMLDDAELCDVFFIDADLGWVVGDRGAVWHTENGGRQWHRQSSPVDCRLESLHFIDAENGWAVGGWNQAYTARTAGIVLQTTDGGRRWTVVSDPTLPMLRKVRFETERHGWAVGNGSSMYPDGIFKTADGGRTWTPLGGGRSLGWRTADWGEGRVGVAAGEEGHLALLTSGEIRKSNTPDLGQRPLNQIKLEGETGGWLVGDGGLVLTTSDGGLTWQVPAGPLPRGVAAHFDFRALAVRGDQIWIAGSPGTVVLRSVDGGKSWSAFRTDHGLAINAITFVDEQRGWATGSLGTILATRDGGQTWRRQLSGGTRAAMLGIHGRAESIPFDLVALLSGNEGYLTAVEILSRHHVEAPRERDWRMSDRIHQSVVAAGASGGHLSWRFPQRQAGLNLSAEQILEGWNQAHDGRGEAMLDEYLVRRIRQWRPDVVITDPPSPRGDDPLGHLVNQAVLKAVSQAADPTVHSEQITLAGLEPWSVKKVFCETEGQETVKVNTAQLATRLGRPVADQAALGRGLVVDHYKPSPLAVSYRLLLNQVPQSGGQRDIFSGLHLQPGGEARRANISQIAHNIDALTRSAQKRRNMENLLRVSSAGGSQASWLAQVDDLTRGIPGSGAGHVLFQLAESYQRFGQPDLAADVFERLVQRHPNHELAEPAYLWLVSYYASGELAWRSRQATHYSVQAVTTTSAAANDGGVRQAGLNLPLPDSQNRPTKVTGGLHGTAAPGMVPAERARRATAIADQVARTRPSLFAEPALRFPLASAHRQDGRIRESERYFNSLVGRDGDPAWRLCAMGELWLGHAEGVAPKTVFHCLRTVARPRLDGELTDAIWTKAERIELRSALHEDSQWLAEFMVAYDEQFLFVAASCRKAPGITYQTSDLPRPRDADLTHHDRVEILLDVDRDFSTFYRLRVDDRGWTAEDCVGDPLWNPTWYVAAAASASTWTVELAIPLDQLVPHTPGARDAWAVGFQRVVPGVGFQSATEPAAIKPRPEGFGYLLFE